LDFNDYQHRAQETDRVPKEFSSGTGENLMVPFLGLVGEAGGLLTEYKKLLRDGKAHIMFPERVHEELGDILWYLANIASKFNLSLDDIAEANLKKTRDRWAGQRTLPLPFDDTALDHERFPRKFIVELQEVSVNGKKKIRGLIDGQSLGDDLTDNAYDPDGYRFHDVFHLGYVAILGWSPVVRKLMDRKRRSDEVKDEVEDGGRAQVVDEAVAALIFEYARHHNWLVGIEHLDYELLGTVKGLTAHLEVRSRTMKDWQDAILGGFAVWRQVKRANGGRIEVDMDARRLSFLGPST